MIRTILKYAVLAGTLLASVATSQAADVTMAHDKDFWKSGFDVMAKKGGFTHTSYATDQYKAYLQSSMTAGNPPDLFTWWTGKALEDVVASGNVAEVDELWDKKIASGEFSAGNRALFQVEGKTYGIPLLLARWVVFYNKAEFEKAGVTPPKTWAELEQVAAKLKAAGVTPFNATVQDGWRGFIWFEELMMRTNPAAYAGLHDGTVPYDGPEVQAVFDRWVDLYAKGYFTDPRSTEEVADFARGKGAMYLMGEWATGLIEEQGMKIGKDFGAFIMPNISADAPAQIVVEGSPILISKAAWADPAKRAAFEYWASVDGASEWSKAQSLYTGNLKASPPNEIVADISDEMLKGGHKAVTRWWEAVPAEIQGDLVAQMSAFMLTPTKEKAKEVMAAMQKINAQYWAAK